MQIPHGVSQASWRLWICIRHPLAVNPEAPHERSGLADLSHAYSNFWVEMAREYSHWMGRGIAWSSPFVLAALIYGVVNGFF